MNDVWVVLIEGASVIGAECRIFDRWGDLTFGTKTVPVLWNGNFNDQEVLPGVYVYMITLEKQNGVTTAISGDVTLIR